MPDHSAITAPRHRATLPALAALVLVLAACSAASTTSEPAASQAAASQGTTASGAGGARCAMAAAASTSASINLENSAFGAAVTITAGQAVAFVNSDSVPHTVTEGTNGKAVADACVDEPIAAGETENVTFSTAGDYDITCKIHPNMHTQVHVQ